MAGILKTVGYVQNLNNIFQFDNADQIPAGVSPVISPTIDINPLAHPTNNVVATGGINITDEYTLSVGTALFSHPLTMNLNCLLGGSIVTEVDFGTGSSDTFTATISQNGTVLASKSIVAGAGGNQQITFTTADYTNGYLQAGSFTITVTGLLQDIYYKTSYSAYNGTIVNVPTGQNNFLADLKLSTEGLVYTTPASTTGLSFYLTAIMISSTKGASADEIFVKATVGNASIILLDINDNNLSQNALVNVAPTVLDQGTNVTVSASSVKTKVTLYGFTFNTTNSGLQAIQY